MTARTSSRAWSRAPSATPRYTAAITGNALAMIAISGGSIVPHGRFDMTWASATNTSVITTS